MAVQAPTNTQAPRQTPAWFDVDKEGLAKLLQGRGPERTILELIQNAWDQNVTHVDVHVAPNADGTTSVRVEDDDPEGFVDLTHAYTLFAESSKGGDAEKRGRFNLGEKLVLAVCDSASIVTTKGTVTFDAGGRTESDERTSTGSVFSAQMRLDTKQASAALKAVSTLIPPAGIATRVNGELLAPRVPVASFKTTLWTETTDKNGQLRRNQRKTAVTLYNPNPGEEATVYEMGIPVMAYAGRWHADIAQCVPLSLERTSLPEAFVRDLYTAIVDNAYAWLTEEDAKASWVTAVMGRLSKPALEAVMKLRFGDKFVAADPTDPEAMKRAVMEGYTVVHGGSLPKDAWSNLRDNDVIERAGKVTPSPGVDVSPNGNGIKPLVPSKWTPGMRTVAAYAQGLAEQLMGIAVDVDFYSLPHDNWLAAYGRERSHLSFNYGKLGKAWFAKPDQIAVDELLLHEFGHQYSGDHLSEDFHAALCMLGARMRGVTLTI